MSYDSYRNEMRLRAWEYRMMLYHAGMWMPVKINAEVSGDTPGSSDQLSGIPSD